jgi:flavin prenyltransferase
MHKPNRIVVGVTGASGAPYAVRLIDCLVSADVETHLIVSKWGRRLLRDELDIERVDATSLIGHQSSKLVVHPFEDVGSTLASGSFLTDGMIICPCSSHTMGEIASGMGDALISRAAAVTLKERRRLILVHREMPLSPIDLRNMLKLSESGAIICPSNPGFYLRPSSVADLVDFVVSKLLDLVGVEHSLNTRWTGETPRELS